MNINTKYNFGEVVYPIAKRIEKLKIPANCPICNDSGEVLIQGKSYTCPECKGHTYHIEEGDAEYYVYCISGKIGKIDVEVYDKECKEESKITYMLDSTGVCCGRLWEEENLFLSVEEAQAECDKRNKERYEPTSKYYIER